MASACQFKHSPTGTLLLLWCRPAEKTQANTIECFFKSPFPWSCATSKRKYDDKVTKIEIYHMNLKFMLDIKLPCFHHLVLFMVEQGIHYINHRLLHRVHSVVWAGICLIWEPRDTKLRESQFICISHTKKDILAADYKDFRLYLWLLETTPNCFSASNNKPLYH